MKVVAVVQRAGRFHDGGVPPRRRWRVHALATHGASHARHNVRRPGTVTTKLPRRQPSPLPSLLPITRRPPPVTPCQRSSTAAATCRHRLPPPAMRDAPHRCPSPQSFSRQLPVTAARCPFPADCHFLSPPTRTQIPSDPPAPAMNTGLTADRMTRSRKKPATTALFWRPLGKFVNTHQTFPLTTTRSTRSTAQRARHTHTCTTLTRVQVLRDLLLPYVRICRVGTINLQAPLLLPACNTPNLASPCTTVLVPTVPAPTSTPTPTLPTPSTRPQFCHEPARDPPSCQYHRHSFLLCSFSPPTFVIEHIRPCYLGD